jgi:glycosyltransferase involved in cell wall biosynthesis
VTETQKGLSYVLITPAYNEEAHLEAIIESMTRQRLLPLRWVIVSDGSTDRTDSIVREASTRHPWIQLLRRERSQERHFAGKAFAVNAAYDSLRNLPFDLVGNLDADITVPPDFYEFLVSRFAADPELGVAGTPFIEDPERPHAHSYANRFADLRHVSGGCQFFRRECFEELGGYTPLKDGGIDWVAVTTARMRGWKTRTFLESACYHHRTMGTADRNILRARFRHGREEFRVGAHPLWQVVRGTYQMTKRPFVLGGLCLMLGYAKGWISNESTGVPQDLREFHRREQLARLRALVRRQTVHEAVGRAK